MEGQLVGAAGGGRCRLRPHTSTCEEVSDFPHPVVFTHFSGVFLLFSVGSLRVSALLLSCLFYILFGPNALCPLMPRCIKIELGTLFFFFFA